ncbi:phospholipase effector Tle1 domain-containing protein [Mycolicibacterium houstonense]|uniref:phospholipase effector Tle1 domain-containing protein n=1 Tax=Mycolicibacterium houstonense TaxID=146021 RepID=UPI003F9A281B
MKNIALCFDHTDQHPGLRDASNTELLFRLLDDADQLTWYHSGTVPREGRRRPPGRRGDSVSEARAAIVEAYRFLGDAWDPGDRIFVFGGGEGGHRAGELATLLGTVGLLPAHSDDVLDYALATYVLPRTARTPQDWRHVRVLAAQLFGDRDPAVPVRFLGMWNATATPGTKQRMGPLPTVESGRHAVAVDGGRRTMRCDCLDEVWFRGSRSDVTGGNGACWPLADITLDWMLDGAITAGLHVLDHSACPTDLDALAGTAPVLGRCRPPLDAKVHASVEVYLRSHPHYWRRLPARIEWVDVEWLARGERLIHLPVAVPVQRDILTAVAS